MTTTMAAWSLPLMIAVPLGLAIFGFLELLSPRRQVLTGVPTLVVCLTLAMFALPHGEALTLALGGWDPPLGIVWQLDRPGAMMLAMTTVVAGGASFALLADNESLCDRHLWPLWWMLWAGLNGLLISRDLFNLYITLELVTLAGVGLVARSPGDPTKTAALHYLLASLLASLLFLLGVALIYGQTGRLDFSLLAELLVDDATSRLGAIAISLGLLIKAAAIPLHTWLPAAHSRAQPPVSAMLSAVVVAGALFVLWRLWLEPFAQLGGHLRDWLALVGGVALAWGGIQAALQARLKLLIAWSTLSQSGYALLLLGLVGTASWPAGVANHNLATDGALQILLSHGLAKAAMFLAAGALVAAYGHDHLNRLAGSVRHLPLAWLAISLAGLSLLSVPPTGGFIGKWWLFTAALQEPHAPIALAVLSGAFFTAASLWRLLDIGLRPGRQTSRPDAQAIANSPLVNRLSWLALALAMLAWVQGLLTLWMTGDTPFAFLLDATGLAFLLPALVVWPVALSAVHAWKDALGASQRLFWTLCAAALAHLLTLVAGDLVTFYTGTALLSLLGWALVQHQGHGGARRAGAVYLAMMLLAEVAILAGIALIASETNDLRFASLAETPLPPLAIGCLALGLGLKAGVIGLHAWLPLAHPVAPPMASAILSGLMIKVGILGALRLLPNAPIALDGGLALVVIGLTATLYGALRGILDNHNKVVLAWSSVSQMGLITSLLGLVLMGRATEAAMGALLALVVLHALAKSALFLGTGMANRLRGRDRRLAVAGLVLPALALAGIAPAGGVLVKASMEAAMTDSALPSWPITLSGIATTLLMLRLFWLLCYRPEPCKRFLSLPRWHWLSWWGLCTLPVLVPWGWQFAAPLTLAPVESLLKGTWPTVVALGLASLAAVAHRPHQALARWRQKRHRRHEVRIAAFSRGLRHLSWRLRRSEAWLMPWPAFGISLGLMALGMGIASLLPG